MYDRILIPTDGSEGAAQAIAEGVSLADMAGATVHGLYVIDTRDYSTLPEAKWLTVQDELEAAGQQALAAVESAAESRDVDVTTTLGSGVPHDEILRHVADHDVDLVVMSTHGRTGLGRVLLGSVTESVIRNATVPVHVVRMIDGKPE